MTDAIPTRAQSRVAYSPEQRSAALALVAQIGVTAASRRLGIPKNTLCRWRNPDAAARSRAGSRVAKAARRVECVRGCGRLTSYDTVSGVCDSCHRAEIMAPCGTRSAYNRGCRCDACRQANTEFKREWYHSCGTSCSDCGQPIVRTADRCRSCAQRHRHLKRTNAA